MMQKAAVTDDFQARVVLACLTEPGHYGVYRLVAEYGALQALELILAGQLLRLSNRSRRILSEYDPMQLYIRTIESTEGCGARIIVPSSLEWPTQLAELSKLGDEEANTAPPLCLWVRGQQSIAELTVRSVAIVGARDATSYGVFSASELAYGLARRNWTVISGAAYGIDAAAHHGALAAEGDTIAVLACGVDIAYPKSSTQLLANLAEKGLIVSEVPPGTPVQRHRFLIRNRLIAALSLGTVVVEASKRSGSRLTARRASDLERVVMAVPGSVSSALSVGTHDLIRNWGASLVTSAEEVVADVATLSQYFSEATKQDQQYSSSPMDNLDAVSAHLLAVLPATTGMTALDLALNTELSPRQIRQRLPLLMAYGLVIEDGDLYHLAPAALTRPKRPDPPSIR